MKSNRYTKYNEPLTKIVNGIINSFLHKNTTIKDKIKFSVTIREGYNKPFFGCNAGSHGEPYNYVIEVDTDIPFPKTINYNDDMKKNKNVDGFHINVLENKIKELLPYLGINSGSMGNVFGVCFTNLES